MGKDANPTNKAESNGQGGGGSSSLAVPENAWKAAFRSVSDAVIMANIGGAILWVNPAAEKMFGIEAALARGDNIFRFVADSSADQKKLYDLLVANRQVTSFSTAIRSVGGTMTPALVTINFAMDDQGREIAIVSVIKDVSEMVRALQTDPVTGLWNRDYLDKKLEEEYERLRRAYTKDLSVLVIDIDHFKRVNDENGHMMGDQILRRVGAVLVDCIRPKVDTAARFGGEELVLILPSTGPKGARKVAERVQAGIKAISVQRSGREPLVVTVSIGVHTHLTGAVSTPETLISQSDRAMYAAKNGGRNQIRIYTAELGLQNLS